MQELKVQITPALVTANYDTLKNYLEVEVAKYKVTVTADTVKDAKKLATELNAVTKGINAVKKSQLEILEAPVKEFKEQIAGLNLIVQNGRTEILNQVKVFEEKTLQDINDLIVTKEYQEYEVQELGEEYQGINFSDLILLGSITKGGSLTKKVSDEIETRIAKAKAVERSVEIRLLQLENECYKAGLRVPLSAEYIKEFLKAEDAVYKERLENLIKIELSRQTQADNRAQIEHDNEKQRLIDEATALKKQNEEVKEEVEALKEAPTVKKDTTPIAEAPEGKKTLRIALSFDVIVRENASEEKVLAKMRELLENAGIPALNKISIEG